MSGMETTTGMAEGSTGGSAPRLVQSWVLVADGRGRTVPEARWTESTPRSGAPVQVAHAA
jgi:hypothetical protein